MLWEETHRRMLSKFIVFEDVLHLFRLEELRGILWITDAATSLALISTYKFRVVPDENTVELILDDRFSHLVIGAA